MFIACIVCALAAKAHAGLTRSIKLAGNGHSWTKYALGPIWVLKCRVQLLLLQLPVPGKDCAASMFATNPRHL